MQSRCILNTSCSLSCFASKKRIGKKVAYVIFVWYNNLMKKKCQDHLGNEYESFSEMCRNYNIKNISVRRRLRAGWSLEDALTSELLTYTTKDHLGNVYSSFSEMCKKYNLSRDVVRKRLKKGWDLKTALTKSLKDTSCKDYLGNEFKSKRDMCLFYNISYESFLHREFNNWSLEDSLTIPTGVQPPEKINKYTDSFGNTFSSKAKAIKFHHIDGNKFKKLQKEGFSFPEIIDIILEEKNNRFIEDHLGNKFKSIGEMCKFYGISHNMYLYRKKRGLKLDEILETPSSHDRYLNCKDHLGNTFSSLTEMSKHYGQDMHVVSRRLKQKWSLKDALETPSDSLSSYGEKEVKEYLDNLNIKYISRKSIKNNLGINDFNRLTADFLLIDFGIIEFDGHQHFTPWVQKSKEETIKNFSDLQKRDNLKTKLCKKYKIPLLRIRYDQVDSIPELIDHFLENPEFYLKRNNKFLTNKQYWSIRKTIK